jgi:hypothetical protein
VRPELLCGLLAEEERLRVYAAVVLGAATPSEAAARTGLPARDVVRALRRLEQGGLIRVTAGRLSAETGVFKEAVREHEPDQPPEDPLEPDPQRAAILRAFIRDGRLVQLPAARAKRRVVLEHIVAVFEPGFRYPERSVDAILRAWYDDYVTIRRHLIDEELMARDRGIYWRVGGYVDVS